MLEYRRVKVNPSGQIIGELNNVKGLLISLFFSRCAVRPAPHDADMLTNMTRLHV